VVPPQLTTPSRNPRFDIARDATGFNLTPFRRMKELLEIGGAAAISQILRIRRLLNRLDPQLFSASTDAPAA
jgi:hypothetical protein